MNGRTTRLLSLGLAAAATLAIGTAAGEATTAGAYKVAGAFGKPGTGNGQFSGARGIAVAPNGNVYISELNNNRIQMFSKSGAFRSRWGTIGTANGQFTNARDVAIAPNGMVWVADDGNGRAQGFSPTGAWKAAVTLTSEAVRGIAVDRDGDVLVAAEGSARAGFRVFKGGTEPAGELLGAGNFTPQDVEASPDGTVYLSTAASNSSDAKVRHFTKEGKSLGAFPIGYMSGIAVDQDCNIWAADFGERAAVKYSPSGKKLATAAFPDLQGQDVGVASNGDLYVTQTGGPIVHFAEDRSKPATAAIPARLTVAKGPLVRISYALRGVSCPSLIRATATLTGPGISGTAASLQLKAGKTNAITMKLAPGALKNAAASGKATFKIVLRTTGRPTVETRSVTVVVPASVR